MQVTTVKGQEDLISPDIIKQVQEQAIFWSDYRNEHWFFDFKVGKTWVSSKSINNELTECIIDLYKP